MGAVQIVCIIAVVILGSFLLNSEFRSVPGALSRLDDAFQRGEFFGPLRRRVAAGGTDGGGKRLWEPETNIFFPESAVRVRRNVEYCQWRERTHSLRSHETPGAGCRGGIHCGNIMDPMTCGAQVGCYYDSGLFSSGGQQHYEYTIEWSSHPIDSNFFAISRPEFSNPAVHEIPEFEENAVVALDNGKSVNASHLPSSVLSTRRMNFLPEHFENLKVSSAYQKGFIFMDQNFITLDYSRINSDHEFFKRLHQAAQFLQTGHIDFAGNSLCTPGDIRVSYTLFELQEPFSIVASSSGNDIVPLQSSQGAEPLFYARPGANLHSREAVLDLEAGDIRWWQWLWRILFLTICVPLALLSIQATNKQKSS